MQIPKILTSIVDKQIKKVSFQFFFLSFFFLLNAKAGGICAGSKAKICAKYAQNMTHYAQKYAQNMRNPKNGIGSGTPYLIIHTLLHVIKYDDIFDQKKVLIILSTLKALFFKKKLA